MVENMNIYFLPFFTTLKSKIFSHSFVSWELELMESAAMVNRSGFWSKSIWINQCLRFWLWMKFQHKQDWGKLPGLDEIYTVKSLVLEAWQMDLFRGNWS